MTSYVHSIAVAVPAQAVSQDFVERRARELLGETYPQFARLARTFTNSGIERRYSVSPVDWFSRPHGWADRNGAYLKGALEMFVDAATKALDAAG